MSAIHYILVSESDGSPVPLPFYTIDLFGSPVTVVGVIDRQLFTADGEACEPWTLNLQLVTEAEYMEKQS
jgi:hypothetical protein